MALIDKFIHMRRDHFAKSNVDNSLDLLTDAMLSQAAVL